MGYGYAAIASLRGRLRSTRWPDVPFFSIFLDEVQKIFILRVLYIAV